MTHYHHKAIRRFDLDGIIYDDSAIPRLKIEYVRLITSEMRILGYVPRLDINNDFTIEYNVIKEYFEFKISVYGIYVGKKKSEWITGIDETRAIYIQPNKSGGSLQEQGSQSNPK